MAIRWEAKRPSEVRDYTHDWFPFLDTDTILTSVWTVSGITKDSDDSDDTTATVWLSGGTTGTTARLTNTITTAGGRTEAEDFILSISSFEEPVSLADAKAHCRILEDTSEDALINGYITAARLYVENYTGHILVRREFTEQRDCFSRFIELQRRPVQSSPAPVVTYTDTTGATQTYATPVFSLDRAPARIFPALTGWWPVLGRNGNVSVTYTAGYAEGDVPQPMVQAILLLVSNWYEFRGTSSIDARGVPTEVPFAVTALLDQYRSAPL